ncbi:MAG: hypothetical protein ACI9VO_002411 [Colwellia sp.]|jgi:hypothetical protein
MILNVVIIGRIIAAEFLSIFAKYNEVNNSIQPSNKYPIAKYLSVPDAIYALAFNDSPR